MTLQDIKENLCWYDKRSPHYIKGVDKNKNCSCDNCYGGKTELAEELLKYKS